MFLFINLNQRPYREGNVMAKFRPKLPPFGIAYLIAMLRAIGIHSILHDDNRMEYSDDELRLLFRKYREQVQTVGLTSITATIQQIPRVAKISKEELPDIPVIVGGPHARLCPEDIINMHEVDVVFTGEAEMSIQSYANGMDLSKIQGIYYKTSGKIIRNEHTQVIQNLDEIPFPAYESFNIAEYHGTKGIVKRHPASYVITSRGCPYNCTYCSSRALNPTQGKKVRFRSPENVLEEIEYITKGHRVREVFFSDDMFTARKSHLYGICEGLIKRKIDLIWTCQTHVNHITEEALSMMKRAGCHQICLGIEAGDPDIQKVINKNLDLAKVKSVVRMIQKSGIDVRASFMMGNQLETSKTLQRTIDYAKSIKPDFAAFRIATPFPGTYLRQWAIENGYLSDPSWEAMESSTYTLVTPDLPPGTVEKYVAKGFRSFYYSPQYAFRRLAKINSTEEFRRVIKSIILGLSALPTVLRALFKKG